MLLIFGIIIINKNMFKRILLCIFLFVMLFSQSLNDFSSLSKDIKNSGMINLLLIIKDSDNFNDCNILKIILFQYRQNDKILKVLCVDDKITILQRKIKSKTLREMFFEQKEENRINFIKNEIESLLEHQIKIDYYIASDIKNVQQFAGIFNNANTESDFKNEKDYFVSWMNSKDYLTSLVYVPKIIRQIINSSNRYILVDLLKFLKIKHHDLITNLKLADAMYIYSAARSFDVNFLRFADVPTINKRNRLEADPSGLTKIIKFIGENENRQKMKVLAEKIKIEVVNASAKSRLAIKSVDKLRLNGFDIFEWGTSYKIHEYTAIFDLIGDYRQSFKVKKILNAGEIIFRPVDKSFVDISVLLGKDCTIYDKLDKIDKISQEK